MQNDTHSEKVMRPLMSASTRRNISRCTSAEATSKSLEMAVTIGASASWSADMSAVAEGYFCEEKEHGGPSTFAWRLKMFCMKSTSVRIMAAGTARAKLIHTGDSAVSFRRTVGVLIGSEAGSSSAGEECAVDDCRGASERLP